MSRIRLGRDLPRARRRLFTTALASSLFALVAGVDVASAHVRFRVDPFDEAQGMGITIHELNVVTVAILGSEHVDPRRVERSTLRLGTLAEWGARPMFFPQHLVDVNGDGFPDRLAKFRVEYTGFRSGVVHQALLTGSFRNGESFTAYDSLVRSTNPVDSCKIISDGLGVIGVQCDFTTSFEPINLPNLITEINSLIASQTDYTVDTRTPLILEAWGGAGHKGKKEGCTAFSNAKPGDGGSAGYASTVLHVSDLYALLSNRQDVYVYVGQNGPSNQAGGSASAVLGQDITGVSDVTDPDGSLALVVAGGGGGGGKGHCVSNTAYNGYHGGGGAVAQATTSAASSVKGDDGSNGNNGNGGNKDLMGAGGASTGGSGSGAAGTDGIGGFGSECKAGWEGSALTCTDWPQGQGGQGGSGEDAGGGGGGFGGGGGGRSGDHEGGGGGGGSWARTATIDVDDLDDNMVIGPSADVGVGTVVFGFQLLPLPN